MNASSSLCVSRLSRRFFLTRVIVAACLALFFSDISPAHAIAYWTTAYSSSRNGHYQIFLLPGGNYSSTPVTDSEGYDDSHPAWHPFFGSNHGGRIAFERKATSGGSSEIYVVDLKNDYTVSATYNITSGISGSKTAPTWSPDGSYLAFVVDDGTSKQVYKAFVNNSYTPGALPHTLAQCSLGTPSAVTSGGWNEDPMWLYDDNPGTTTYINGNYYNLHKDYGIAYVHRSSSSGNGDIYRIPAGGGTAVNMTAAGDPYNSYDDVHPNITTFGVPSGEISFTSNRGLGAAQEIYKTDGSTTTAQTALNTSGYGYWSGYSAYHVGGSVEYIGGVEHDWDLVIFVSKRPIDLGNGLVDAVNLYGYNQGYDYHSGIGPVAYTHDGPGVENKEPCNVYHYAELDEEGFEPIGP